MGGRGYASSSDPDLFKITLHRRGTALVHQDGRQRQVKAGDLLILDTRRPYTLVLPDPCDVVVLRLFRSRDGTFMNWVRWERLTRVKRDLSNPAPRNLSTEAIARGWGVTDVTHLARALRTEFGCTAAELRSAAQAIGRPDLGMRDNQGMRFGVLGPVEVRVDGAAVPVGGPTVRALLAMLLLDAGRVVSVERLIDGLYGEEPPSGAANALQSQVSRLRRGLGDAGLVEGRPAGYRMVVDGDDVDVHRFERLARDGRLALGEGRYASAAGVFEEALGLW
ncbi:MAG: winged helix-turn-helix domain-containing protein, partial [Spirillospora sp.]